MIHASSAGRGRPGPGPLGATGRRPMRWPSPSDRADAGLGPHGLGALVRIVDVHRHVGRADGQDREDRHVQLRRAGRTCECRPGHRDRCRAPRCGRTTRAADRAARHRSAPGAVVDRRGLGEPDAVASRIPARCAAPAPGGSDTPRPAATSRAASGERRAGPSSASFAFHPLHRIAAQPSGETESGTNFLMARVGERGRCGRRYEPDAVCVSTSGKRTANASERRAPHDERHADKRSREYCRSSVRMSLSARRAPRCPTTTVRPRRYAAPNSMICPDSASSQHLSQIRVAVRQATFGVCHVAWGTTNPVHRVGTPHWRRCPDLRRRGVVR